MSDWKVSLIATVRNEKASLASWVEALARQTKLPHEVVICDGGSADGTVEELQRLSGRFRELNITVVSKTGANIAAGRNAAIANAQGPIIAVTDAGCVPEPNWLEEVVKPFDRSLDPTAPQLVAGSYRYRGDSTFQRTAAAYLGPAWLHPRFRPSSRSVAFTKSAWAAVGGYPEWLTLAAEDTLFNEAVYNLKDVRIHAAPNAIVHWDMRANLGSFLRMIRRNAFGDAEAGLGRTAFLVTVTRLLALIFVVMIAGMEVALAPNPFQSPVIPVAAAVLIFVSVLWTRKLPAGSSRVAFLLLKLLGGPSYVIGYVHGLAKGKRPPRVVTPSAAR
ncbi:MAG TPA: glycosyltransferase [Planctomycetota bacterium]|nr:glycosyltransferase [Planctomycetota bacterium]